MNFLSTHHLDPKRSDLDTQSRLVSRGMLRCVNLSPGAGKITTPPVKAEWSWLLQDHPDMQAMRVGFRMLFSQNMRSALNNPNQWLIFFNRNTGTQIGGTISGPVGCSDHPFWNDNQSESTPEMEVYTRPTQSLFYMC